jgi:hypothetical protein
LLHCRADLLAADQFARRRLVMHAQLAAAGDLVLPDDRVAAPEDAVDLAVKAEDGLTPPPIPDRDRAGRVAVSEPKLSGPRR